MYQKLVKFTQKGHGQRKTVCEETNTCSTEKGTSPIKTLGVPEVGMVCLEDQESSDAKEDS